MDATEAHAPSVWRGGTRSFELIAGLTTALSTGDLLSSALLASR